MISAGDPGVTLNVICMWGCGTGAPSVCVWGGGVGYPKFFKFIKKMCTFIKKIITYDPFSNIIFYEKHSHSDDPMLVVYCGLVRPITVKMVSGA